MDVGVQNVVEVFANVRSQKSKHEILVLLKKRVFAPVTTISLNVGQVLVAVQFDDNSPRFAEKIHFHRAISVKRDWQFHVESKAIRGIWERLQSAKKKGFARASGPHLAFGIGQKACGSRSRTGWPEEHRPHPG